MKHPGRICWNFFLQYLVSEHTKHIQVRVDAESNDVDDYDAEEWLGTFGQEVRKPREESLEKQPDANRYDQPDDQSCHVLVRNMQAFHFEYDASQAQDPRRKRHYAQKAAVNTNIV